MAESLRSTRSLTEKADQNYTARKTEFKEQLRRLEQQVLLLTRSESDLDIVERKLKVETEDYLTLSDEFCAYLAIVKTEDSERESREQCMLKDRLIEKVNSFYHNMKPKIIEDAPEMNQEKASHYSSSHHSSRSHRSSSSRVSEKLILTQAKVQAAKAKLKFAELEMTLRKQRAALLEEESIALATTARRKIDLETDLQLLKEQKELEAAKAEADILEMASVGEKTNLESIPESDPDARTADYVNNYRRAKPEDVNNYNTPNINKNQNSPSVQKTPNPFVSEVGPNPTNEDSAYYGLASDFTRFLLKKDLLISRLNVFDDKPENYLSWKTSFKNIMEELNVSAVEEVGLVIKFLGPHSRRQAMTLRSAYGTTPWKALVRIWERMEERYGAPELLEEAVKRKLAAFPNISARDSLQLYELADIVSEIECIMENPSHQASFAFYDSAAGVSPIVNKLPHFLQEKWITQASQHKRSHNVTHPPFSFFAKFVWEMAQVRNDPSFYFHSTATPVGKNFPERNQRYAHPERNQRYTGQTVSTRKNRCQSSGLRYTSAFKC